MKVFIALIISFSLMGLAIVYSTSQTVPVTISWSDSSTNEDGFNVYQCVGKDCNPTAKIGQVQANVVTYRDTLIGDPGNRTICYAVTAFNSAGESPKTTSPTCITTPAIIIVPGAPTGVLATIVGGGVTVQP